MQGLQRSSFENVLRKARRKLQRVVNEMEQTEKAFATSSMEDTYRCAFSLAAEAEGLTLLARDLPAHTGHPGAPFDLNDMLLDVCDVQVGYTKNGWFSIQLPALLPRKERGSADYIRTMLYPHLHRFFLINAPLYLDRCVVAFRHVYDDRRPEREYRDHDNIEVNMVVDLLSMYTMKDDSAMRCRHFYCSAAGDGDRTEVYVVPHRQLSEWLSFEEKCGKKAIMLQYAIR